MEMATLQFYKNKYRYPKYTNTLTSYGSSMDCTPVGINLHGGTIRVKGTMTDFMSCNYLSLARDGQTLWAWIDDVKYLNDNAFEISYTVDAWRTYKNKIDLGIQFIKRSPTVTNLKDPLLGSIQPFNDVTSQLYTIGNHTKRVVVVQVRAGTGETFSNTPAQPTPYQFYLLEYTANSWQDSTPLSQLMSALPSNGQTKNIVTLYSVPWFDTSGLPTNPLTVLDTNGGTIATIDGFKVVDATTDLSGVLYNETDIPIPSVFGVNIFQIPHSVQVVIPEAGILNIPDELLAQSNLRLRQDIDVFSGACNYMLVSGDTVLYTQSVRGSSVSSIPILSNPEDTYISQNQNALTTSLIGDVANLAIGFGMMSMGPAGRFLGSGMAGMQGDFLSRQFGTMAVAQAGSGILDTMAKQADGGQNYANPPAFLGTALTSNFNGQFWVVTTSQHVTNWQAVNQLYGYPYNLVDTLTFPASGYIETQNCNVSSTDGSVPRWALNEINSIFNSGILVL
jgi:hypothetical protein